MKARGGAHPVLNALVDSTRAANLDLALAVARVEESRALLRISTADLFPGVTGSAGGSRQNNPVNAGFGAIIGAILGGACTLIGTSTNLIVNGFVQDQIVFPEFNTLGLFETHMRRIADIVHAKGGLMYEATIGGQKFSYTAHKQ